MSSVNGYTTSISGSSASNAESHGLKVLAQGLSTTNASNGGDSALGADTFKASADSGLAKGGSATTASAGPHGAGTSVAGTADVTGGTNAKAQTGFIDGAISGGNSSITQGTGTAATAKGNADVASVGNAFAGSGTAQSAGATNAAATGANNSSGTTGQTNVESKFKDFDELCKGMESKFGGLKGQVDSTSSNGNGDNYSKSATNSQGQAKNGQIDAAIASANNGMGHAGPIASDKPDQWNSTQAGFNGQGTSGTSLTGASQSSGDITGWDPNGSAQAFLHGSAS